MFMYVNRSQWLVVLGQGDWCLSVTQVFSGQWVRLTGYFITDQAVSLVFL